MSLTCIGLPRNDAQVLKGLFDALVLHHLTQGESYGLAIHQAVTARMGDDGTSFRESTLYPLLHRLEAKGFVQPHWKPGLRGTDRKYYGITRAGREHLVARSQDWAQVVRILERTILAGEPRP